MPWNASVFLFCLFDATFQPTVGESVAFVEVKVALVCEEASTVLRRYASDAVGRNNRGGEVNKVLPPCLQWDALVQHHGELRRLSDEHLEGVVLLVEGAQGHRVGVQVQGES